MLAKPSTQLTMRTHPSAGVFNPLKFALSHEEEEVKYLKTTKSKAQGYFQTNRYASGRNERMTIAIDDSERLSVCHAASLCKHG